MNIEPETAHRRRSVQHRLATPDGLRICHSIRSETWYRLLSTCEEPALRRLAAGILLAAATEHLKGKSTHAPHGERHHHARLTTADVSAIRHSTESGKEVAQRYGVHHSVVSRIRNGKRRLQG